MCGTEGEMAGGAASRGCYPLEDRGLVGDSARRFEKTYRAGCRRGAVMYEVQLVDNEHCLSFGALTMEMLAVGRRNNGKIAIEKNTGWCENPTFAEHR